MFLKLLRFTTIISVALLQGLAFAHLLERPAKLQYDASLYITLQKTLYVQWGPPNFGGFLEPIAIVTTWGLAFFLRKDKRGLWLTIGAGTAPLAAFPMIFFWLVAPANNAFQAATPGTVPPNWMELRSNWEMGHVIRFFLQLLGFVLLVLSVVSDGHKPPTSSQGT